jgi:soluble lytic murein transglycosylase
MLPTMAAAWPTTTDRPMARTLEIGSQTSQPLVAGQANLTRQALDAAQAQRRLGEREAALELLRPLQSQPDADLAAEAGLLAAAISLEQGAAGDAAAQLTGWLQRYPKSGLAERAIYLLGIAKRRAEDCPGALDALSQYQARNGKLAAHAAYARLLCQQQLGDLAGAIASADAAAAEGAPRLLQVEALEIKASMLEQSGDLAGTLATYERLLQLARTRSYQADMRLAAARLNLALGRGGPAVDHLVWNVREAPAARSAAQALDRLNELGALDRVSYYQAGLVRYNAGDLAAAIRNFDGSLASPGEGADHPSAALNRAIARVRSGSDRQGVEELLALPGRFPASPRASEALLRAGRVLEALGRPAEALGAFRRLVQDYPGSPEAAEGRYRQGLAANATGGGAEAQAAWQQLADADGAPPAMRSLALLWLGKLAQGRGDGGAAQAAWQAAGNLAPTSYGGLRSIGQLRGGLIGPQVAVDPARVDLTAGDLAELDAWTAARGGGLEALLGELAASPGIARADELLSLGLDVAAGWELDSIGEQRTGDAARLAALAVALHRRGLDNAAMRQTYSALAAAGIGVGDAPVGLQKLIYPLAYSDALSRSAGEFGVDPLLLAGLVLKESEYNPSARSSANALGLTQVVPSTGQGIATALGYGGFSEEMLFRPSVSLRFGAYYLGQKLKRYGAVLPALAAYNAGEGNVNPWLRDVPGNDPDLFAERIPFAETNRYVKVVLESYGTYRALYGAR